MSLTRQQMEEKAKQKFEWVEVEGFGKVGIQSISQLQLSRRYVGYTDPTTGNTIPEELVKQNIHNLIDQIMIDEKTPMFTDEDFDKLATWRAEKLDPIYRALEIFNGDEPKNA